jgi:hypothetical protein
MPIVNKYGFQFASGTTIGVYTNPTLNMLDTKIRFTLKYMDPRPHVFYYQGGTTFAADFIGITTPSANRLEFRFQYNSNASGITIQTPQDLIIGTLYDFEIIFSESAGNIKIELYRDDILIDSDTTPIGAITTMSFNENPSLYRFGDHHSLQRYTVSVLADFVVETDGIEVFNETFNEFTKGAIFGDEQYTIISSTVITGVLLEKKDSWNTTEINYSQVIESYYFGGLISFSIEGSGSKKLTLYGYYDKARTTIFLGSKTVTGNAIEFDIVSTSVRRLYFEIEGVNPLGNISYLISQRYDIWNNTEQIIKSTKNIDKFVYYSNETFKAKSLNLKVPDELRNKTLSLLEDRVYIDDVLHKFEAKNANEYDTLNWIYSASFMEILNEQ